MTIEKNVDWATESSWPENGKRFDSDRALAQAAAMALAAGETLEVMLDGGDLRRTLGTPRPDGATPYRYVCDLGFVQLDGGSALPFVAHVVCHRRWWRGEAAAAMNAAYVGDWYLGPKSHPNDGLLDVTVGALAFQQRMMARRRAPQGVHVPHPDLTVRRVARWHHRFDRATPVYVDGRRAGRAHEVEIWLAEDAFAIIA